MSPVPDSPAPPPERVDLCVVGGGILGLAVAREFQLHRPGSSVVVLEKETEIARHQTGHNSGVVHAGLYYKPGSAKAVMCRRGVAMLRDYAAEKGIVYHEVGKLVVARDEDEQAKLRAMLERAASLGVPGLHIVDSAGIRDREPAVRGRAALVSPSTAIIDYVAVARAYRDDVVAAGGQVLLGAPVSELVLGAGGTVTATVPTGRVTASLMVICAGLHTDRLDRSAGGERDPQIMPFRGEYYRLRPERQHLVRSLVYPVPDPRYPFLGVHFTKRVDGAVDVGPNAILGLAREGYARIDISWRDVREMASYAGAWRLAWHHARAGATELLGSLSKSVYTRRARSYVPELSRADLVKAPAGIRAQAVTAAGGLADDFVLHRRGNVLAVRNAPSPAATASLAIAEHIIDQLLDPEVTA